MPIVKGNGGLCGSSGGLGVAGRIRLGGLVKLKKRVGGQTPRPVTGNLEVEPMETKIFSGAEFQDFRGFLFLGLKISIRDFTTPVFLLVLLVSFIHLFLKVRFCLY